MLVKNLLNYFLTCFGINCLCVIMGYEIPLNDVGTTFLSILVTGLDCFLAEKMLRAED